MLLLTLSTFYRKLSLYLSDDVVDNVFAKTAKSACHLLRIAASVLRHVIDELTLVK